MCEWAGRPHVTFFIDFFLKGVILLMKLKLDKIKLNI